MALGPYFQEFIEECVTAGEYGNATEVVRDALRGLRAKRLNMAYSEAWSKIPTMSGPLSDNDREAIVMAEQMDSRPDGHDDCLSTEEVVARGQVAASKRAAKKKVQG